MLDLEVSPEARIGERVQIGYGARIYPWAVIGDDTVIGDYCIIGHPNSHQAGTAVIGSHSTIRSHTVIYRDVETGPRFETGHHALVRDGTRAGINLRIGSYSDVEGACFIGDYCRFHGFSHIGRGSRIGHFCWIFSSAILLNDPLPPSHIERPVVLEDGVVVSAAALVMPGAVLGKGAFVAAGAHAHGDVPAGAVVDGPKGEIVSHVALLADMQAGTCHPWMRHFADAYPSEAEERLKCLLDSILAGRRPRSRT